MCVGKGGMPLDTFWHIRDLHILEHISKGVGQRDRTLLFVGKVISRTVAMCVCRGVSEDFPYRLPWMEDENDATAGKTEAEKIRELEAALPDMMAAMEAVIKEQKQNK